MAAFTEVFLALCPWPSFVGALLVGAAGNLIPWLIRSAANSVEFGPLLSWVLGPDIVVPIRPPSCALADRAGHRCLCLSPIIGDWFTLTT